MVFVRKYWQPAMLVLLGIFFQTLALGNDLTWYFTVPLSAIIFGVTVWAGLIFRPRTISSQNQRNVTRSMQLIFARLIALQLEIKDDSSTSYSENHGVISGNLQHLKFSINEACQMVKDDDPKMYNEIEENVKQMIESIGESSE